MLIMLGFKQSLVALTMELDLQVAYPWIGDIFWGIDTRQAEASV